MGTKQREETPRQPESAMAEVRLPRGLEGGEAWLCAGVSHGLWPGSLSRAADGRLCEEGYRLGSVGTVLAQCV